MPFRWGSEPRFSFRTLFIGMSMTLVGGNGFIAYELGLEGAQMSLFVAFVAAIGLAVSARMDARECEYRRSLGSVRPAQRSLPADFLRAMWQHRGEDGRKLVIAVIFCALGTIFVLSGYLLGQADLVVGGGSILLIGGLMHLVQAWRVFRSQ